MTVHADPSEPLLTLTAEQVARVRRLAAAKQPGAAELVGRERVEALTSLSLLTDRSLSRSLLLGLLILISFPADGGERTLTEIATDLELAPPTAHRYLTTLVAAALLTQNPATKRYRRAPATLAAR